MDSDWSDLIDLLYRLASIPFVLVIEANQRYDSVESSTMIN